MRLCSTRAFAIAHLKKVEIVNLENASPPILAFEILGEQDASLDPETVYLIKKLGTAFCQIAAVENTW